MVSTGVKHAVATGGMDTTWQEWKIIEADPAQASYWTAWKDHWKSGFQTKRELVALTGISYNGMANQAAEQDQADDVMGDHMANALDSLANAAVLKTETCETLVATNKKLTQELSRLASIIQTLTIQLRFNSGTNNTNIEEGGRGAGEGAIRGTGGPATNQPWDPHGYFWSHGFKVRIVHSSGTCNNRKTGHVETAARTKTMGGVKWNSTWVPRE